MTTDNTTIKNLTMSAIKSAMPEFFAADTVNLIKGLTDAGARVTMLADALVGVCIERAQSGNMPKAWLQVDATAQTLKGATKDRVNAALSHVLTIGNASLKSANIEDYKAFADTQRIALVKVLTPALTVKKGSEKETPKQTIERLTAELSDMTDARDAFKAALIRAGVDVPHVAARLTGALGPV